MARSRWSLGATTSERPLGTQHVCRTRPSKASARALAACLPLLAGCSLPAMMLGHFEPPDVTLSASRVESLSPSTAVVQLVLTVGNSNAFGLTTRAVTWHLRLNGHGLAAGRSASRVTVPAHGSAASARRC